MKNHRFKPQLENLERRDLMAGNVMAEVVNGDLVITGDNADNSVTVHEWGSGYVVYGNYKDGAWTTIDGAGYEFHFNVNDDIRVDLKNGDNRFEMYGRYGTAAVPDDIIVKTGSGHDDVILRNLSFDDLEIRTGTGNDEVYLSYVHAGNSNYDHIFIDMGENYRDWDKLEILNSSIYGDSFTLQGVEQYKTSNIQWLG